MMASSVVLVSCWRWLRGRHLPLKLLVPQWNKKDLFAHILPNQNVDEVQVEAGSRAEAGAQAGARVRV